ncbi:MAG: D-alanyl-D-alanine carboxypeptidase/D-alanyl-D-alanine endopeptidase [Burkholderiales bacterium]
MKSRIRLVAGIGFLVLSLGAQALPPPVKQAIRSAKLPESSVAIWAQEVHAKDPLVSHNAQVVMNPASVMKLLTTYAGLDLLGPAFTWKTEVYTKGERQGDALNGDLMLKGYGDPKFTLENLWLLLRNLRARGLREIRGDLVLDRSYFSLPSHIPADFDGKATRPYNVGPDALLLNFHTVELQFLPNEEKNLVGIAALPMPAELQIVNLLTLDGESCGDWREKLDANVNDEGASAIAVFRGSYSADCAEKTYRIAVLNQNTYILGVFRQLWEELGGTLVGGVREESWSFGWDLLTEMGSLTLAEAVRDINKFSNNVMARQLFLTIGAEGFGANGSLELSREAIGNWLANKSLNFPELILENGSGLSRKERISAAHMGAILLSAWRSPLMPEFIASLPLAGLDGTMKRRLNGSGIAGQAHLKTGSLEGVKTVAGYVLDQKGRRIAVVCFVNHANSANAKIVEDALLHWLHSRP